MSESIRRMFSALALRYDRSNRAISLGLDMAWRRRLVALSGVAPGSRVLDLCCGTGDVALLLAQAIGARASLPVGLAAAEGRPPIHCAVTAVDFSEAMLNVARQRAQRSGYSNINFVQADALHLPFDDASFDIATIAFGLRNLDDPLAGLREMARVVRPGGRICILETGQPRQPVLRWLYRRYCSSALLLTGALLTGQPHAYAYLQRTALSFPCGEKLAAMLREADLCVLEMQPLAYGVAWLYVAERQSECHAKQI